MTSLRGERLDVSRTEASGTESRGGLPSLTGRTADRGSTALSRVRRVSSRAHRNRRAFLHVHNRELALGIDVYSNHAALVE